MTALQEFIKQLAINSILIQDNEKVYIVISPSKFDELVNQAKEMEKQQIIDAYMIHYEGINENIAEQYYNETYKNK
jgi:lysine/ornithine N-monooxygenase